MVQKQARAILTWILGAGSIVLGAASVGLLAYAALLTGEPTDRLAAITASATFMLAAAGIGSWTQAHALVHETRALVSETHALATSAQAEAVEAREQRVSAQAEVLKRDRRAAVLATWEVWMARVDATASTLLPPGQRAFSHEPLEAEITLVGDLETARQALALTSDFARRPKESGLTTEDMHAIATTANSLRAAARRQLELVAAGQEPVRIRAEDLGPIVRGQLERFRDRREGT
jgi:hypothetical protein